MESASEKCSKGRQGLATLSCARFIKRYIELLLVSDPISETLVQQRIYVVIADIASFVCTFSGYNLPLFVKTASRINQNLIKLDCVLCIFCEVNGCFSSI